MKNIFFAAISAFLLTACSTTPVCSVSKGEFAPGVPEYTFNNGMIEIKVLAGISGIVDHFRYLPEKRDLFEPMAYNVETHDLLPEKTNAKVTGGRELIWGIKHFVNVPMDVKKVESTPEKAFIVMGSRYFQGENIEAEKTVTIEAGTLAVDIDFSIKNRNRKPQKLSLWKHLTAQFTPEQRDLILIPTKGGVKRIGRRAMLEVEEDVILHDFDPNHHSAFFAPLAPWIARSSSDGVNRGTLVMSAPSMMAPGAIFYSWKHNVERLHTAEMILPAKELAPGEAEKYRIRYYFFPHLAAIRGLAGDIGINVVPGALELESVSPRQAAELTLIRLDNGKEVLLGKYQVPALKPGKLFRIALDKNIDVDNTVFQVILNGEKTVLPKVKK